MEKNIKHVELRSEIKVRSRYARMKGEFIGTLEGLLHWDLPEGLKAKVELKLAELKKTDKEDFQ